MRRGANETRTLDDAPPLVKPRLWDLALAPLPERHPSAQPAIGMLWLPRAADGAGHLCAGGRNSHDD